MGEFSHELRRAHMANVKLDVSQQRLRSEIKDMQEDLDLYLEYLDDKMDLLVRALGIRGLSRGLREGIPRYH